MALRQLTTVEWAFAAAACDRLAATDPDTAALFRAALTSDEETQFAALADRLRERGRDDIADKVEGLRRQTKPRRKVRK